MDQNNLIASITGELALVCAAMFAAAALYVGAVEQPARLRLDDRSLLTQWRPSYARGTWMQAPLAVAAAVLGGVAWCWGDQDWAWVLGALLIFAPVPWTLLVMWPTNTALKTTDPELSGAETRRLVHRWGRLHVARTVLSIAALMVYLYAILA